MSYPHENWFFSEAAALAERFAQAAKEARDKMRTPCELADASVRLNDAGTERVVAGDVAGYHIEATSPWGFDGDLPDAVRMLIRGLCEQRANSRDAGCRIIGIVTHTNERSVAAGSAPDRCALSS